MEKRTVNLTKITNQQKDHTQKYHSRVNYKMFLFLLAFFRLLYNSGMFSHTNENNLDVVMQ